jgi:hypothetical protein
MNPSNVKSRAWSKLESVPILSSKTILEKRKLAQIKTFKEKSQTNEGTNVKTVLAKEKTHE